MSELLQNTTPMLEVEKTSAIAALKNLLKKVKISFDNDPKYYVKKDYQKLIYLLSMLLSYVETGGESTSDNWKDFIITSWDELDLSKDQLPSAELIKSTIDKYAEDANIQVDGLKTQLELLSSDIDGEISQLKSDINNTLEETKGELNSDIDELQTTSSGLREDLDSLRERTVENEIVSSAALNQLNADFSQSAKVIAVLEKLLFDHISKSKVKIQELEADLKTNVSTLNNAINTMEEVVQENELTTAVALHDLNDRLLEVITVEEINNLFS